MCELVFVRLTRFQRYLSYRREDPVDIPGPVPGSMQPVIVNAPTTRGRRYDETGQPEARRRRDSLAEHGSSRPRQHVRLIRPPQAASGFLPLPVADGALYLLPEPRCSFVPGKQPSSVTESTLSVSWLTQHARQVYFFAVVSKQPRTANRSISTTFQPLHKHNAPHRERS